MGPPGDEDELERRVSLTDTEGDLSRLDQPSTEALVDTISAKFRQFKRIYYRIGDSDLLALNPWECVPVYDSAMLNRHLPLATHSPPNDGPKSAAHIFATTAHALKSVRAMIGDGRKAEEAIVFCGEAGAGKTQNLFQALQYLAFVEEQEKGGAKADRGNHQHHCDNVPLSRHTVTALERILTAFGCAKTLKNDRSTRHGYAVKVHYRGNSLAGISVDSPVPPELSRIVGQRNGERNFGIFYQFCCGLSAEWKERLGLLGWDKYFYLNQGKCPEIDTAEESRHFVELDNALSRIHFSAHQKELFWHLLASILHIGNIFYKAKKIEGEKEEGNEFAELANETELRWVSLLLHIDFDLLKQTLTHSSKGQRLSVDSALDMRDSLAKTLYAELFKCLLSRLSMCLGPRAVADRNGVPQGTITLVDVPGFERYGSNGYEELCTNLIGEQIEMFFQRHRFGQFRDEELKKVFFPCDGFPQHWPNNGRIVDLLVKRPMGILPLLDDECKFPRGSAETFLQHCNINHLDKSIYAKARVKGRLELGIRHHFGLTFYATDGFLEKNRFPQPSSIFQALARTKDVTMAAIFGPLAAERREDRWVYVADEWHRGMDKLIEQLKNANLHFVRCVRANNERIPGLLDPPSIQRQFRALSLPDHCRAMRAGFQHKMPIALFANSFRALLPDQINHGQNKLQIVKDLLASQGHRFASQCLLGSVHVFLADSAHSRLCDLKLHMLTTAALTIQCNLRKFLARRAFLLKRGAATRIQAAYKGWKCRRTMVEMRKGKGRMEEWKEKEGKKGGGREGTRKRRSLLERVPEGARRLLEDMDPGWTKAVQWAQVRPSVRAHRTPATVAHPPPPVPTATLEQFAAEHIKSIAMGARREPIFAPYLAKDSEEEFEQSLLMFKLVLCYQFESDDENSLDLAILAKAIIRLAFLHRSLSDELFLQLLNQTHSSLDKTALDRAWTLLLCALNSFGPSQLVFPLLYSVFQEQSPPLSRLLLNSLLRSSSSLSYRTLGPSLLEHNAFVHRRTCALSVRFADGETAEMELEGLTTAEELIRRVIRKRGIDDPFGCWCLNLDDGVRLVHIHSSLFPFDAIAQIEQGTNRPNPKGDSPFAFFISPKSLRTNLCQSQRFGIENGGDGGQFKLADWRQETVVEQGRKVIDSLKNLHAKPADGVFYRPKETGFRPKFDPPGIIIRRKLNPNCMSRITEREEENVPQQNGGGGEQKNESGRGDQMGSLGRIRNMPVPTSDRGVDRFLDDVFEQALPPTDYELEEEEAEAQGSGNKFDRVFIGKLAASIKGGDFYEPALIGAGASKPREGATLIGHSDQQHPKRFVYRAGGGIFVEDGGSRGTDIVSRGQPPSREPVRSEYRPNGEFVVAQPFGQNKPKPNWPAKGSPMGGGLRRFYTTPSRWVPEGNEAGGGEDGSVEEEAEDEEEEDRTSTLTPDYEDLQPGDEWVPESEITLDALFSTTRSRKRTVTEANVFGMNVGRRQRAENGRSGGIAKSGGGERPRAAPLAYAEQPFELMLRREVFAPGEVLDDAQEIDLVFAQIIRDCKRQLNQPRIRRYEREAAQQLLRSYNIPPEALNTPAQVPTNVKLELIGIARKWPLYFCRLFPVTEERLNERVPLFLGVSESGIRLISISPPSHVGTEPTMVIQDHFELGDLADLVLEDEDRSLRMVSRQNVVILLSGTRMDMAKQCIESFMDGGTKRRHFVVALSDYDTRDPNVLNFESGDYIQLIDWPDSEMPATAGQWLYGKLDGRFGWMAAEYVMDAEEEEGWMEEGQEQLYSSSCGRGGGGPVYSCSAGTRSTFIFGDSLAGNIAHHSLAMAIPPALEPLFNDLDPSAMFVPDPMGAEQFTLLEFALRFFRPPKGGILAKKKNAKGDQAGNWPGWRELAERLAFSDRPIAHSLLRMDSHEADRVAQQSFLAIMRFMGDELLKRNQSLIDCVHELLSLCHAYVPIRDEVYCQLAKQLNANGSEKCAESALRGWRLLTILCAYYVCTDTLKPYLVKFLGDIAFDPRHPFNGMAKMAMYNMAQTVRFGGRRMVLAAAEVEAIANGQSVRRQWYHLPGGHRRLINTRSVTVAEEIVQAMCVEMNIRSAAEQQEFTLCYILSKDNSVHTLLNDEYVMDVSTELETRGDQYLFILTRNVWLHPLRRDSDLCTDALFFQMLPNYLAGLLISLRVDGAATASTMDDAVTLGALLLLSYRLATDDLASISDVLPTLVPKTLLSCAGNISVENWAQRIRSRLAQIAPKGALAPVKARRQFLEIVEDWPLFGAAFYSVRRVFAGKNADSGPGAAILAQNCVLAVNRGGVRVLAQGTHRMLAEFALDEIHEMAKYSVSDVNLLELRLSPQGTKKHSTEVVTVETELGNEISRQIGHYIFLSNGSTKQ